VDFASKLQAIAAGWHLDVGEEHSDVFSAFHQFDRFIRIGRFDNGVTVVPKQFGCVEP
jgi:hypothetical protein